MRVLLRAVHYVSGVEHGHYSVFELVAVLLASINGNKRRCYGGGSLVLLRHKFWICLAL